MEITRPTLLVDKEKCLANIRFMSDKAKKNNVLFRPHFKTHNNISVGRLYRNCGVDKITVSSVEMAEFFMNDGWNDITIAVPVNIREIDMINEISQRISLNILAESVGTIDFLDKNLKNETGLFVKIDAGYRRTGIWHESTREINNVVEAAQKSKKLNLKGFVIHSGHTYAANSRDDIFSIHNSSLETAGKLKNNFPGMIVSIGDTPGCSLAGNFENIDEIRPGNFVYYDMMQYFLGSCTFDKISVAVACPVIAVHPQKGEIVIYGGGVHLSKESIMHEKNRYFGALVKLNEKYLWDGICEKSIVKGLSQEHGVISADEDLLSEIKPGMLIGVIPVHSCMAADLLRNHTILL